MGAPRRPLLPLLPLRLPPRHARDRPLLRSPPRPLPLLPLKVHPSRPPPVLLPLLLLLPPVHPLR